MADTPSLREFYERTTVPLVVHQEKLREADQRALQIKEKADEAALELQRTTQTYKDEQANELRVQLKNEREDYARSSDLSLLAARVSVVANLAIATLITLLLSIVGVLLTALLRGTG
jgi:hypothetical protein